MISELRIKAIIGLGNEGREYAKTYHNIGAFGAQLYERWAARDGVSLKFFKLEGFMNNIDNPVFMFAEKNNVQPSECLIIRDDSDLLVGSYKLVQGGRSGGHKGAESIIVRDAASANSWRWLKIGVRDPKEQVRQKAGEFVLEKWSKAEEAVFIATLEKAWEELRDKKCI